MLCCSESMRSLQIVPLALGNSPTSFFPQTNSEKCMGISEEESCGCKEWGLLQAVSKHSDPQEKLCCFLPAISEITINPNKKVKRKFL